MTTQVQCPNPTCRLRASVPEDQLGHNGRCERCGTRFLLAPGSEGSTTLTAGQPAACLATVGRFQIRQKLGGGAFGTVYRAFDPQLNREVALKLLHAEKLGSEQAVKRFQREARAAAKMHHPHIVPVHDAGQDGEHLFIASALIPGSTLSSAIPNGGMEQQRAARLTIQLTEALAYAHKQGVLHRDVKCANILLDEQDTLYLTDFGLAGWTEPDKSRLTSLGVVVGTPAYMAPEQASGDQEVGPKADLYSAGVVLFEMLTGHLPFEAPMPALLYQIVFTPPPAPSQFRPGLDKALEAICLKALAKKPEERQASGQEMAAALQSWLQGQQTQPPPRTLPEPLRKGPSWKIPATAAAFLMIGLAALLIALGAGQRPQSADKGQVAANGARDKAEQQDKVQIVDQDKEILVPEPLDSTHGPVAPGRVQALRQKWAKYLKVPEEKEIDLGEGVKLKLVLVPPGKFRMGATKEEIDTILDQTPAAKGEDLDNALPRHEVELTRAFYLGKFAVTQQEYQQVMGSNPSWFRKGGGREDRVKELKAGTNRFPVELVSWYDAVDFCNKLSDKQGQRPCYRLPDVERHGGSIDKATAELLVSGTGYRLPTEAEWEFACRAGTTTIFHFGDVLDGNHANSGGNYPHGTKDKLPNLAFCRPWDVGFYPANAFGLHDMHGNVNQWCQDWYDKAYYSNGDNTDPKGPDSGSARVMRGGSFNDIGRRCRAAVRVEAGPGYRFPNIGFRVALALPSRTP